MSDKLNSVQNTSYTAKDFQTIFPELLDLVSQLTNKWDPSASNESDPGVILLKLDALIADKLNYAIDKNTLECFPLSVTQLRNARQLYDQLGYRMKWYKSATTQVSVSFNTDEPSAAYVAIPAFTMVSDENTSKVYTLIGPSNGSGTAHVGSGRLIFDGSVAVFDAIEGIALNYEINGSKDITINNLDSNNRLYFNIADVAENGIYITNIGENNYSSWTLKDNLVVESLGNYYYTFGISQDSNSCYIEFPEDAETIIKNGINITYIKSSGASGNIVSNTLSKFYADVTLADSTDTTVVLNQNNTVIKNLSASANGSDPETINDAYKHYKRTVGTFETLVTLRDYVNAIISNNLASNGYACDRSTDPQSTYSVICNLNGVSASQTYIDKNESKTNKLTAFDLKLYLLKYSTVPTTLSGFEDTFTLMNESSKQVVEAFIEDSKSISHDYAGILTPTDKRSNICMIVNEYPVVCRIITKSQVTDNQAEEIVENVKTALFKNLNSSEMDFGENISLELLIDTITDADVRIKSTSVDNFVYTTYGVYAIESASGTDITYKKIKISDMYDTVYTPALDMVFSYDTNYFYEQKAYAVGDKCIYPLVSTASAEITVESTGVTYTFDNLPDIYKCKTAISRAEPFTAIKWNKLTPFTVKVDGTKFGNKVGVGSYPTLTATYTGGAWKVKGADGKLANLTDYGVTITATDTSIYSIISSIIIRQSLAQQMCDEIYTKSVLCGATPLFKNDEKIELTWGQAYNCLYNSAYNANKLSVDSNNNTAQLSLTQPYIEGVYEIATNVNISVSNKSNEYILRNNEYLQIFYPNLIDSRAYSNYVKFEYKLNTKVSANEEYELSTGEYVAFYWKPDGEDEEYYNYYVYSKGNIIKPSMELAVYEGSNTAAFNELIIDSEDSTYGTFRNIGSDTTPAMVKYNGSNGSFTSTHNDTITSLTKNQFVLSGSKKITIRKVNTVELTSAYNCYWITNSTDDFGNYKLIFNNNKVTLDTGEYFIYTDTSMTNLVILGAGTTLEYNNITGADVDYLIVTRVSAEDVLTKGADAVSQANAWYIPDASVTLLAVENKYNTYNPGTTVRFEPQNNKISTWSITFNKNTDELSIIPATMTLADFNISYRKADEDDFTKVDVINLTSVGKVSGRSLLTLNIGTDTEQALLSNQQVDIYQKDLTYHIRLLGHDLTTNTLDKNVYQRYYPIALKANATINFDGAGVKHVSYYDSTQIVYPTLYLFSKNISSSDGTVRFNSQGDVSLFFPAGTNYRQFEFGLPIGNYIVQFDHSSKTIGSANYVEISEYDSSGNPISAKNLITMYGEELKAETSTFLSMSLPILASSSTTWCSRRVGVTLATHTDDVTVTLSNPYKYTHPSDITDSYFEKIRTLVNDYDVDKVFNYLYQVDESSQIENPLAPNSYLLSNHPYHNYTICKLDTTSNTNLMLMNKK